MHATTHYSPTALTYARALLELAGDQAGAIGEELGGLRQIIDENPTFAAYLADPGISEAARAGMLDRTFRGKVSPLLWNFLGVLNLKGRLRVLHDIVGAYDELLDEKYGKVEVDLTVAHPMTEEQLAA